MFSGKKTDIEIINSYKNGENESLKELIDKYTPSLYNFVAHIADKNDAPDITQETFIKIWKNINNFDENKANFKTWIFNIAKNTAIDYKRKNIFKSGLKKFINFSEIEKEDENFEENIIDEQLLPDETLQKLEDAELLNKTLEQLKPEQKTILILYYQEDMTLKDIGIVLGKRVNTVKSQHRRALISLREKIEKI